MKEREREGRSRKQRKEHQKNKRNWKDKTKETGKSKNELSNLKSSYSKLAVKCNYLKNIKTNFCTANQRNKTFLMRKLFQIRKLNENLQISSQIKNLSTNSAQNIQNFTEEESFLFSEIFNQY